MPKQKSTRPHAARRRPPNRNLSNLQEDLNNISIQETRLTKKLEKALIKLSALQNERKENQMKNLAHAKRSLETCKANEIVPDFVFFGFPFTMEEFEMFLRRSHDYFMISGGKTLDFDYFLADYRAEIAAAA